MSSSSLERHYRAWMWLYPRDYRRRHGLELLTTLLDAAAPGRSRPDRADLADLVRGGLRQRFRLPVGRWTLVVAVVACLLGGASGASLGAGQGWRTGVAAMPDDAEIMRLATLAAGQGYPAGTEVWGRTYINVPERAPEMSLTVRQWDARASATRLAADGWDVGSIETSLYRDDLPDYEVYATTFVAERDGLLVLYEIGWPSAGGGESWIDVTVRPATPWTVWAFAAAGALLAATGAWLLVAWAAYRLRRAAQPWRSAGAVAGVATLATLALPAIAALTGLIENAIPGLIAEPTSYLLWEVAVFGPPQYVFFGAVALLIGSLAAGSARPSRESLTTS